MIRTSVIFYLIYSDQKDNFASNDEVRHLVIASSIVLFTFMLIVIVLFTIFQRRKIKFIRERNLAEKRYLEEVTKSQLEIQENALKNVSWELHDNVGQLLSVANLELNILCRKQEDDSVVEIKELVSKSLQEVRALSKGLNIEVISKLGLVDAIENELKRFERLKYLDVDYECKGKPWSLSNYDSLVLFRIIQEFFSNVIKHAKGESLTMSLNYKEKSLEISIKDDGVGFDMETISKNSGLINMESRAKLIGASFKLDSQPNVGTTLKIKYPKRKIKEYREM